MELEGVQESARLKRLRLARLALDRPRATPVPKPLPQDRVNRSDKQEAAERAPLNDASDDPEEEGNCNSNCLSRVSIALFMQRTCL